MTTHAFRIQKYTAGTRLVIRLTDSSGRPIDLRKARSMRLVLRDPDGGTSESEAERVSDGQDGKLYRTVHRGELARAGTWEMQAHVRLPSGLDCYSAIVRFEVLDNLESGKKGNSRSENVPA